MNTPQIKVQRLLNGEDLQLPQYQTPGSAGMDVRAAENLTLSPGETRAVSTGFALALPDGFEAQLRPRSGLALKHGITLPNAPGTIDSDFRAEIKVIMHNLSREPFEISRGDRIAQMVIARVERLLMVEVETLDDTRRGAGGFGSTGKN